MTSIDDNSSLDDVPLAYIYPTLRTAQISRDDTVLQLEDLINPPPDYQDAENPPAYQTKSQSVPPTRFHNLACFLVNYDLVTSV
jgi:hypothetical protein